MDLHLENKVVIVTGASKGIGLAIARSFAQEGARVVAGARTPGEHLAELGERHGVLSVAVDLNTADGAGTLVDAAVARFGTVDVLVNNVGSVSPRLGGFLSISDDDWLHTINANLFSAVRASRAALPHLLDSRGAIVNIGSVNAILPDPSIVDYAASKAALASFAKSLSKEVGPQGVRVNTISPGPVETDIWLAEGGMADTVAQAMGVDREAAREAIVTGLGGLATGRFTRPAEVADLALLLASDRTANVTGADFTIDGGLIKTL
ncbi:oxidoreductase [Streptomyces sp. NRRL WC-3725]|uniref:oxidoreductase n=1 Tax=Streptomyces sp. NRRL WC-3725 TaxID=1463933 RepID=UPI0004C6F342|nr:oxidoreductase [Streptomyces sp. NRRL WC-3725]